MINSSLQDFGNLQMDTASENTRRFLLPEDDHHKIPPGTYLFVIGKVDEKSILGVSSIDPSESATEDRYAILTGYMRERLQGDFRVVGSGELDLRN